MLRTLTIISACSYNQHRKGLTHFSRYRDQYRRIRCLYRRVVWIIYLYLCRWRHQWWWCSNTHQVITIRLIHFLQFQGIKIVGIITTTYKQSLTQRATKTTSSHPLTTTIPSLTQKQTTTHNNNNPVQKHHTKSINNKINTL